MSAAERFWRRVDAEDGTACWRWTGYRARTGYGQFGVDGRVVYAHRFAYEDAIGPIPPGLTIDHLCFNPACVNPAHLEVVTHRVNILRGNSLSARRARMTTCANGHPFDHMTKRGRRMCLTCKRATERAYKARRKYGMEVIV